MGGSERRFIMLSNCHLSSIDYGTVKYQFAGAESMLDYSKRSVLEGDYLVCRKQGHAGNLIISRLEFKEVDLFVFVLFANLTVLATIKSVNFKEGKVTIGFLNPDKSMYPDQVLHFDDIKSMLKVTEVHRSMVPKGWCHCAVDGDYCGEGCMNN